MSTIALIKNGLVENIIIGDLAFALAAGYPDAVIVAPGSTAPAAGWSYSNGQFLPPVSVPQDLDAVKATWWEAIKRERDRRTQTGGYHAAGHWFHSDVFSRTQQMGLVMMGANIPGNLQWKTMNGTFVTMTPALAQQVFEAAAVSDAALFARAEEIRIAMETNPLTFNLQAQSWPAIYGEN